MRMKLRIFAVPLILLSPWLTGCGDQPAQQTAAATNPHAKTADEIREEEENKPPYIGMTKAQAMARYGEPKQQTVTEEGEQWTYLLNFGSMMGKALIPFNFKPTVPRIGVLTFGADGKVKKFRWDADTDHG